MCEKRIREHEFEIKNKTDSYDKTQEDLDFSKKELEEKQKELKAITAETQKDEEALQKKVQSAEKKNDSRLLKTYYKLRNSYRNGLAVVSIERESCSGCHNKIPPQTQLEIRQRKKIIVCEHCGRILVDEEMTEN